ncbi:MAG: transposase [Planctomycetes bacterium]|nr:transposase [Planctomycetota bacterium]
MRDECLNEEHFGDAADARKKIDAWRVDYNGVRPHTALDGMTPDEFANRAAAAGGHAPRPGRRARPKPAAGCLRIAGLKSDTGSPATVMANSSGSRLVRSSIHDFWFDCAISCAIRVTIMTLFSVDGQMEDECPRHNYADQRKDESLLFGSARALCRTHPDSGHNVKILCNGHQRYHDPCHWDR